MQVNRAQLVESFGVYVDVANGVLVRDQRPDMAKKLLGASLEMLVEMDVADVAAALSGVVGITDAAAVQRLKDAKRPGKKLVKANPCLGAKDPASKPVLDGLAAEHPAFYAELAAYLLAGKQDRKIGQFFWTADASAARLARATAAPEPEEGDEAADEGEESDEDDGNGGFSGHARPEEGFLDNLDAPSRGGDAEADDD